MSCQACKEAQEVVIGNFTGLNNATYVRVGRADVLIAGCDEHLKDLIRTLRDGRHAQDLEKLEENG